MDPTNFIGPSVCVRDCMCFNGNFSVSCLVFVSCHVSVYSYYSGIRISHKISMYRSYLEMLIVLLRIE